MTTNAFNPVTRAKLYRFGHAEEVGVSVEDLREDIGRLEAMLAMQAYEIQMLEAIALQDRLTSTFNRMGLERELGRVWADYARHGRNGAALLFDLDGFKTINDTFGHAAGDAMLKAVAAALMGHVRAGDAVGRLGGDEFLVVLSEVNEHTMARKRDELLAVVCGAVCRFEGMELTVGASVGGACFVEGADVESVMALADERMYDAKREGK